MGADEEEADTADENDKKDDEDDEDDEEEDQEPELNDEMPYLKEYAKRSLSFGKSNGREVSGPRWYQAI